MGSLKKTLICSLYNFTPNPEPVPVPEPEPAQPINIPSGPAQLSIFLTGP